MIFNTISVCYVRITVGVYAGFTSAVVEIVPAAVHKMLDLPPFLFVPAVEDDFV